MIPHWNLSGVLPPFDGSPTSAGGSPYWTTTEEAARRFAHSPARRIIFQGLLKYRRALLSAGVTNGFQWVDGSFIEDIERMENRNPGDVDLVTFGYLPVTDAAAKVAFYSAHEDLMDPKRAKHEYHCHAFFVDLSIAPRLVVNDARYWYGLFSHRRATYLWKGLLALDLAADDSAAWAVVT